MRITLWTIPALAFVGSVVACAVGVWTIERKANRFCERKANTMGLSEIRNNVHPYEPLDGDQIYAVRCRWCQYPSMHAIHIVQDDPMDEDRDEHFCPKCDSPIHKSVNMHKWIHLTKTTCTADLTLIMEGVDE